MSFVVLHPHSTNPSDKYTVDKYTVVWLDNWLEYVNGATSHVAFAGQFDKYADAMALRDELNRNNK